MAILMMLPKNEMYNNITKSSKMQTNCRQKNIRAGVDLTRHTYPPIWKYRRRSNTTRELTNKVKRS